MLGRVSRRPLWRLAPQLRFNSSLSHDSKDIPGAGAGEPSQIDRPDSELQGVSIHHEQASPSEDHSDKNDGSKVYTPLGIANQPPNKNYIILGADRARLIPRKRPEAPKSLGKSLKVDVLEEQRKQLLVFKSEAPKELVFTSISSLKPFDPKLSKKRYEQLKMELGRSYTVSQIRAFLAEKAGKVRYRKSDPKAKLIDVLLSKVWNLRVSDEVSERSDVVVERSIGLTRREIFHVISESGKMPRNWTKSGAHVVILASEQRIIIRSTENTFNWIMAELHTKLESIQSETLDMRLLNKVGCGTKNLPLSKIQQLTDVYIEVIPPGNYLRLFAPRKGALATAKRVILQASGVKNGIQEEYLQETSPELASTCDYARVLDDDSVHWANRSESWWRWQARRTKQPPLPHPSFPVTQPQRQIQERVLSSPDGSTSIPAVGYQQLCHGLAQRLNRSLGQKDKPVAYTVTFGQILRDHREGAGDRMSFFTNIPFITEACSQLPFSEMDVADDPEPAKLPEDVKEEDNDLWAQVLALNADENQHSNEVSELTKKLETDNFTYFCQIKLSPSPYCDLTTEEFEKLPPIEVWLDIDNMKQAVKSSARFIIASEESNIYVPLPDKVADLRLTATIQEILPYQDSLAGFLRNSKLDFSGNSRLGCPATLDIEMNGKKVQYLYDSMFFRRQADLQFKNKILLHSSVEGGLYGGKTNEALLFHESDKSLANDEELAEMFLRALEFDDTLR
uniref:ARAD1B23518p n=1 Tax=Blastobotrys adeninivorans TaxID=409370 RepID=A0A060TDC2_BLAAD